MKGDPGMVLQHAQAVATMSDPFDPYRKWLGIPPKDQPPNHYRLLGIAHFEDDPDVIENAATRQIAHVRMFQSGKHSALSQKILNELTAAKLCLLQAEKKAPYDEQLRAKLSAEGKLSSDNLLVTSRVDELPTDDEPPAYEDPPREEVPDVRRAPAARWKTDAEDVPPAEPPIVPIPMPMGIAVAAPPRLSPSIPHVPSPLMVSGLSRSSYRTKRKSASRALPIAIVIICLLVLIGGGIAVAVLSGAFSKPTEKHPKKAAATSSVPNPQLKSSAPESSSSSDSSSLERPEASKKKGSDLGAVEDELRQALFQGRQALEKREADRCKTYVVTAENLLVTHSEIDSKLREQVHLLRELLKQSGEFWSLVRDAAINDKVPRGEKFNYRKEEFELVSHEGDLVTYKLAGKEHTARLTEIQAKAALALAFHATTKDQGKRLAMLAFGMIDKRAADEHFDHKWAQNLYTRLALEGHTNALLARELGVDEKPDPAKTKVPAGEDEKSAKDKPDSK